MRILYITNQDPNGVGGGAYGSHAYLKAFSELCNGNIDICMADSCGEMDSTIKYNQLFRIKARRRIRRLFSVFTGELHRYTDFVRRHLQEVGNNYDLCVLDHSLLCNTLIPIVVNKGMKIVVIHHNFEREYFTDNLSGPFKKVLLLRHYINSERKGYLNSDLNLFVTKSDITKFEEAYGNTKSKNRLMGTFQYKDEQINSLNFNQNFSHSHTYVITGAMDVHQGIDGVMFFLDSLYRYLPKESKVIIAGKSPSEEVINKCKKYSNVTLIPNPTDMGEILSVGDIYICPTREGGGIKLRVMDGLKYGMPVIVHKNSARGYDLFKDSNCFFTFETEEEFKLCALSAERVFDNSLDVRKSVINRFQDYFSYTAGKKRIEKYVSECLQETNIPY